MNARLPMLPDQSPVRQIRIAKLKTAWRRWKPYRPFVEPTTGQLAGIGLNLLLLGLTIRKFKEMWRLDLFFGPWGLLLKMQIDGGRRGEGGFHLRLALDAARSYLLGLVMEWTWSGEGLNHVIELLGGPFGFIFQVVERFQWGKGRGRWFNRIQLLPAGILLKHELNAVWADNFSLKSSLGLGPYRSITGFSFELDREQKKPGRSSWSWTVGPAASLLRAILHFASGSGEKYSVYGGLQLGPNGALARMGLGFDLNRKPVRPFLTVSVGPGRRYGYLYRHPGSDSWITGMDLTGRSLRKVRIIAFDALAVVGQPVILTALVVEGMPGFLSPPVPKTRVRFLIDGREIGRGISDDQGWVHLRIGSPPFGKHRLLVLRTDQKIETSDGDLKWPDASWTHSESMAGIISRRPGRPVLLIRLEGLITTGWEQAFVDQDGSRVRLVSEAAQLLHSLADRLDLVYLSGVPVQYAGGVRNYCFGKPSEQDDITRTRLPRGALIATHSNWTDSRLMQLPNTSEATRPGGQDYLQTILAELMQQGVDIVCGISHLSQDQQVFDNTGLNTVRVKAGKNNEADSEDLIERLTEIAQPDFTAGLDDRAAALVRLRDRARDSIADNIRWRLRIMAGISATEGNLIHLYPGPGPAVADIFSSIEKAEVVHLSTMILGADRIGARLTDQLIEAAQRGAVIRLIIDQWLSEHSETFANPNIKRLAKSKVRLRLWRLAEGFPRCHKKTIAIVRQAANGQPKLDLFVGGMNWTDASFGNFPENLAGNQLANPERDLFARVWGPAAMQLQQDFLDSWTWTSGLPADKEQYRDLFPSTGYPANLTDGKKNNPFADIPVCVIGSIPGRDSRVISTFLALIDSAQSRICIEQNFPPGQVIIEALIRAMKRGVQVDWIFGARRGASALLNDNLNHNKAAVLLKAGYEIKREANLMRVRRYPITVHMKAMVIDEDVLYFGTANLDPVSLETDAETMLVVPHPPAARAFLADWFRPDFAYSSPVTYNPAADTLNIEGNEETPRQRLDRIILDAIMPEEVL